MISDPSAARRLLQLLSSTEVRFAVLHREPDVQQGLVHSDIDVIVDRSVAAVIFLLDRVVRDEFVLITYWEYDVGSVSTFWSNSAGEFVVQLDMIHDPRGDGRYGLLTDLILDRRVAGVRHYTSDPKAQETYKLVKRHLRRHSAIPAARKFAAAERVAGSTTQHDPTVLSPRVLRSLGLAPVPSLISVAAPTMRSGAKRGARVIRRILRPAGVVVSLSGLRAAQVAENHMARWGQWLPNSVIIENASTQQVLLAKVRPGLTLLIDPTSKWPVENVKVSDLAGHEESLLFDSQVMSLLAKGSTRRPSLRRRNTRD